MRALLTKRLLRLGLDATRNSISGRSTVASLIALIALVVFVSTPRVLAGSPQFIRGDCNVDGSVQISDAIFELSYLFVPGSSEPSCSDACDANGDLSFNISDAIYLLSYLFVVASPPPPPPFPDCGASAGSISCLAYSFCVPPPPPPPADYRQEPSRDDADAQAAGVTDHVHLATGEVRIERLDLMIPGRGELHFALSRHYRSQLQYDGPLGQGWDHIYNEALSELPNGDVLRRNGRGHIDIWQKNPDGSYTSPAGHFRMLRKLPNGTFVLRAPNGFKRYFDTEGRLARYEDRNGHRMLFAQDAAGRLDFVVDAYGRVINFNYGPAPDGIVRLQSVTDFLGREVAFSYSAQGDLIEARSPIVTGTSTGNDFPAGRAERYAYSNGFATAALNHNLLSITRPQEVATGGAAALSFTYGTDAAIALTLDRALTETEGGLNASGIPAGGAMTFAYESENPGAPLGDLGLSRLKVTVTERNGNVYDISFNELDHAIRERRYTRGLRPGEPPFFETRCFYDLDGQLVRKIYPELNELVLTYDSSGPRAAQRNLLSTRVSPGPRGGGEDIVTTFTYEPLYQQVATRTDPRGNALMYTPPIGVATAERYTARRLFDYQESSAAIREATDFGISLAGIARGLGDLNADGITSQLRGNPVRVLDPTVILRPGSRQATATGSATQMILTEIQWNEAGQVLAMIDPEGNVQAFDYYPENDPDGDGTIAFSTLLPMTTAASGYARLLTEDSAISYRRTATTPPAMLATQLRYDPAGNMVAHVNSRGVETHFEVNTLNETVVMTRGAEISDAVSMGELVTGESAFAFLSRWTRDHNGRVTLFEEENRDLTTPGVGAFVEHTFIYDILDNVLTAGVEVDGSTQATTLLRYDENEQLTLYQQPAGNKVTRSLDERNLQFRLTRGADAPEAATAQWDYDLNGNRTRVVDSADNNGDGQPEAWLQFYDGFDRLLEDRDPLGNRRVYSYDVASNLLREQNFGHPAGQPTAPAVLLADTYLLHDELQRVFQLDQALFLAAGFSPIHPVQLLDGNTDGRVSCFKDYDALSRPRFVIEDDGEVLEIVYDGVSRAIETIDALGNRQTTQFDRGSNPVELRSFELSPEGLVPNEEYVIFHTYDQLDRRVRSSADLTTRYSYDSRDNLIGISDPQGSEIVDPLGLFPGTTNTPGNTRSFQYDGRNLRTRSITDLRLNGSGDQPIDLSNPFNPDGRITVDTIYDLNGRVTALIDDNLNVTAFSYDALDRPTNRVMPDATVYSSVYDGDDNVLLETDPNGTTTARSYDAANRLVLSTITPAFGVAGSTLVTHAYDGLSRLTSATDTAPTGSHTITCIYDSLSRMIEEQQDGAPSSSVLTGDGKRLTLRYPGGRIINRVFDSIDRISSISDSSGAIAGYAYIGPDAGRPLRRSHGNGTQLTLINDAENWVRGYDEFQRPIEMRHKAGSQSLVHRDYKWNRAGERLNERRNDDGGFVDGYTYDSDYRITRVELDTNGFTSAVPRDLEERVTRFDGAGNRREVTDTTVTAGVTTVPHAVNALNQYTTIGATARVHDQNGNVVDDGTRLFAYDYRNRLVAVRRKLDNALIATYEHDALDRRVRKLVYNPDTGSVLRDKRYYYDSSWRVVEERNPAGVEATYVYGVALDEPVQMTRTSLAPEGAGVFTPHQNSRGDVVAVSDATGHVVERTRYTDFGAFAQSLTISNPWLFQGREYDAETGLYHFRNRAYDPEIGRFLQRDPVHDPRNSGNLYSFANSGPVTHQDPYGLSFTEMLKDLWGYDGDGKVRDSTAWAFVTGAVEETPRSIVYGSVILIDEITLEKFTTIHEAAEQTYVELGLTRTQRAVHRGVAGTTAFVLHWLALDGAVLTAARGINYVRAVLPGARGAFEAETGIIYLNRALARQSDWLRTGGSGVRGFLRRLWYHAVGTPAERTLIHELGHKFIAGQFFPKRLAAWLTKKTSEWYGNKAAWRVIEEAVVETVARWRPFSAARQALSYLYKIKAPDGTVSFFGPEILVSKGARAITAVSDVLGLTTLLGGIFSKNYRDANDANDVQKAAPPPVKAAPPPPPLVVLPDSYILPPSSSSSRNVSFNDTVNPATAFYEIVTAPPLDPMLFDFHENGNFLIAPLTSQTTITFTYRVTQGTQTQTTTVTIQVNRALLYQLTPFTDPATGLEMVNVPCLVLGGLHYPIYQFNLSNNPADVCTIPHWHRPAGQVFPLETPTIGIFDPNPPQCGFGTYPAVPQEHFAVPFAEWQDFLIAHIPPL